VELWPERRPAFTVFVAPLMPSVATVGRSGTQNDRVDPNADVVVVGAGVIGCSIAYEMARSGYSVAVVDKGPAAGAGSTSSSSAIIRFHYSTLAGVTAAWESVHLWKDWENFLAGGDASGLASLYQPGCLVLDPPGNRTADVLALFEIVGVPYHEMTGAEVAAAFPALDTGRYFPPKSVSDPAFWAESNGNLSAYFTPDAGFIDDPQLATHNLMVAATRHGASFSFGVPVTGVTTANGSVSGVRLGDGSTLFAPVVVNAAGPFSSKLNQLAGVADDFAQISTRALRQEVHVIPAPEDFTLGTKGTIVNDADLGTYFRPQPGGTILVGGVEPDCDPLVWIDDPDSYDPLPTADCFEAQALRCARRVRDLHVPTRPVGLAALYDVTPDWVPVYDRTSLQGFYVAIGTSGNQFKNAPLVGRLMRTVIEAGTAHDRRAARYRCEVTGNEIDLGHYSRLRQLADTTKSVLG
jgi:sarcosine oxidase, subunit beta